MDDVVRFVFATFCKASFCVSDFSPAATSEWCLSPQNLMCQYCVLFYSFITNVLFSEVVESLPTKKLKKSVPRSPAFRAQSAVTVR